MGIPIKYYGRVTDPKDLTTKEYVDGKISPSASSATPQMDGTADAGSSAAYARGDHVHPSDTSRVPVYGMGENLLDNADFSNADNIVDQRGGYVLAPASSGTNYYYTDSALTQDPVAITDYTTVYSVTSASGYRSFKLTADGATTYYAALDVCVRGYVASSNIYTFDRWKCRTGSTVVALDDCIKIIKPSWSTTYCGFNQGFKFADLAGKTVTLSVLVKSCATTSEGYPVIGIYVGNSVHVHSSSLVTKTIPNGGSGLYSVSVTIPETSSYSFINITPGFFTTGNGYGSIEVIAAKLELGTQQTLAHQENGEWVLNRAQKYGDELRECQRYFQKMGAWHYLNVTSNNSVSVTWDLPTTMRITPQVTIVSGTNQNDINYSATRYSVMFYKNSPSSGASYGVYGVELSADL